MAVAFSVENLSYKYPSSEENVIKGMFDVLEGEIFDCWVLGAIHHPKNTDKTPGGLQGNNQILREES